MPREQATVTVWRRRQVSMTYTYTSRPDSDRWRHRDDSVLV